MDIDRWLVLLANLLLFIHFIYVAVVVLGQLIILAGWIFRWAFIRNLVFRIVHLGMILFVALLDILDRPCPLTVWENRLRDRAGQLAQWEMTFVERLLRSLVFCDWPAWFFNIIYIGFALMVLTTFILVPPRRKNRERKRPGSDALG